MHELSIVMEVVRQVQEIAAANHAAKVEKIVLQIGEGAPVVPRFIEECFPAAVDGTSMEETKLELEVVPALGLCNACGKTYRLTEQNGRCTYCGESDYDFLSGRDFVLKEIVIEGEEE
ncbi:MAG: hydrogenase maturation nickel metallochaperone HypA [Anaerolineaceae bacterium]|nr:hydrogenase maturation nickel metallochaperone HypA [Anaerolineaceae bacterium]